MSKYTTEVRFICETCAGLEESEGYNSIQTILDNSRDKIFDFDFPIFDENYRPVLENKILKHYYTREIGAESVGLWKLWLDTRLNEIMPYYNQLYTSELIKFNPLYDIDLTTTHNKEDNRTDTENETQHKEGNKDVIAHSHTDESGNSSEHATSETNDATKNDHWEMFSDTPSGALDGVRDEKYLTTALHTTDDKKGSKISNEGNGTSQTQGASTTDGTNNLDYDEDGTRNKTATFKNIQDYAQHVVGKTAGKSYSKMLTEFRETFLNIDLQIINELSDLFMTLW